MLVSDSKHSELEKLVKQAVKESLYILPDYGYRGFTQFEKALCAAYTTIECGIKDHIGIKDALLIGVLNGDFNQVHADRVIKFLFGTNLAQ